jgi:hypothetical protein
MQLVRAFFQTVGAFWAITIIGVILAAGVIVGGQQAGFWLDSQNAGHQAQMNNKQYQAQVQSDTYQKTYLDQSDKAYQQVTVDKFNIDTAKASKDPQEIQDAYAASATDVHIFCGDAQKLTDFTRTQFTPGEAGLYASAC